MGQHSLVTIRQAVAAGEFDRALLLWNECAAGLTGELRDRRLSGDTLREVNALVEWSRSVVLCARAHLLAQLNALHVAGEYEPPIEPTTPCIVQERF